MSRLLIIVCVLIPSVSHAAPATFPYEAVVEVDANVRSGPGKRSYPTAKIKKGARVTVRRHDLGGWYMINPPQGSFSWIRAEYVNRQGARGMVTESDVVVRVGSSFGLIFDVIQRRLSKGDQVSILGAQTVDLDGRAVEMLQIAPPAAEYRWINGQVLTPIDANVRQQHDTNPYATPSNAIRQPETEFADSATAVTAEVNAAKPTVAAGGSGNGVQLQHPQTTVDETRTSATLPARSERESQQARLRQIDNRFRQMIRDDTSVWNLQELEADYRQLQSEAVSPALKNQVELRFPAIRKYQRIKQEYDEFVTLTSQTAKRDAELLRMQRTTVDQNSSPTGQPTPVQPESPYPNAGIVRPTPGQPTAIAPRPVVQPPTVERPVPLPRDPMAPSRTPASAPIPTPTTSVPQPTPLQPTVPQPTVPQPTVPQPTAAPRAAVPKLIGAGIVQRSVNSQPGSPQHVLLTPQGRILAYLSSKTIDLNQLVGQSIGIQGQRGFRRDLQMDMIEVTGAIPVRLRQP